VVQTAIDLDHDPELLVLDIAPLAVREGTLDGSLG
jgi:hypothetical protein